MFAFGYSSCTTSDFCELPAEWSGSDLPASDLNLYELISNSILYSSRAYVIAALYFADFRLRTYSVWVVGLCYGSLIILWEWGFNRLDAIWSDWIWTDPNGSDLEWYISRMCASSLFSPFVDSCIRLLHTWIVGFTQISDDLVDMRSQRIEYDPIWPDLSWPYLIWAALIYPSRMLFIVA